MTAADPDPYFICPGCGPHVSGDRDDGCCVTCGADVFTSDVSWYVAALRAAREEERERCAGIAEAMSQDSCPHLIDESCCIDALHKVAAAIRSGAPAAADRVREAERAACDLALAAVDIDPGDAERWQASWEAWNTALARLAAARGGK